MVFAYIITALVALACLYPFWYALIASISNSDEVAMGNVLLLPKLINFDSYSEVFRQDGLWKAYENTIFYTVVGTSVNMFFTICGAYPLSKRRLRGRKFLNIFIAVTMWFQAGMIPMYLNFRDLNLLDSRFGIIISFAVSTFYVILMRTFFESVPDSMEESAKIDGANDIQTLIKIYIPLSIPAILTLTLYYAVERWNGYFWAMIMIREQSKLPLQVLLTKLIIEMEGNANSNAVDVYTYSSQTIVYATIMVSIIPIILVYPFIQKFFVRGIMVGSIKG